MAFAAFSAGISAPHPLRWQRHWDHVILVLEEIEGLVAARVPLPGGLQALAMDAPNHSLRRIFHALHEEVSNGCPLHEALARQQDFLPSYCVDAVRAGEESGRLEEVLRDLQAELQEMLGFRTRVQATGSYLFGVLLVEAMLILMLLSQVLPQALEITTAFGQQPTFMMRALATAQAWKLPLLLAFTAIAVPVLWTLGQVSAQRDGKLAQFFARLGARVPLLHRIQRCRHLGHGAAIAGVLIEAGLPLHEAFRAAGQATRAPAFKHGFQQVALRLEQGDSLREALHRESAIFPAGFRGLLSLGESSGQLPEALAQVKALYRAQALRNARLLLDIGGPIILCLTAACVFAVYFAFFQWLSTLWTLLAI